MKITENHFAANAEIALKSIAAGYRIKEVPISWINRTGDMGSSSFRLFGVGPHYVRALRDVIRWMRNFKTAPRTESWNRTGVLAQSSWSPPGIGGSARPPNNPEAFGHVNALSLQYKTCHPGYVYRLDSFGLGFHGEPISPVPALDATTKANHWQGGERLGKKSAECPGQSMRSNSKPTW